MNPTANHFRQNKSLWISGLLVLGGLGWSYHSVIAGLVSQWINNGDYSHGLLMVPIVIYLVWQRRAELKQVEFRSDWRAFPLLLLAIGLYATGELGAELFTTRFSMLIFILGLTWCLYGFQVVKILRFPLAFMFLMLPLPGLVYRNITFPLQLFASRGAVQLLHTFSVPVFRQGNVIDLGFTQLQVVEACNGLRYILPLLTFGVLFAYFGQKVFWKRMALILSALPIAILANVARIAGTGLIGNYWGKKAAEGFFHSFSGWAVFMLCVALFALLNAALRATPGHPAETQRERESRPLAPSKNRIKWTAVFAATFLVLTTPFLVNVLGGVPPVPLKKSLDRFPLSFMGMTGKRTRMEEKLWEHVGGQSYVIINYMKEDEPPIDFYVAYYEYQHKAGDFIHSPRLCLPGAGWYMEKNHVRHVTGGTGKGAHSLKFNELLIEKGPRKQLVYFWYQGRGRNFTSEWAAKFYMVWDGMFRRRTDGALVRLMTPLPEGRTVKEARRTLDRFALAASHTLGRFLP